MAFPTRAFVWLTLSLLSLVPLGVISFFALFQLNRALEAQSSFHLAQRESRAIEEINRLARQISESTQSIASDPRVAYAVLTKGEESLKAIIESLGSRVFSDQVAFLSGSGRVIVSLPAIQKSKPALEPYRKSEIFDVKEKRLITRVESTLLNGKRALHLVSAAAIFTTTDEFVGIFEQRFSGASLIALLKQSLIGDFIIADSSGAIVVSSLGSGTPKINADLILKSQKGSYVESQNFAWRWSASELTFYNNSFYLITLDNVTDIQAQISQYRLTLFGVIGGLLLLIVLVSMGVGKYLIKPIERLAMATDRFRSLGEPIKLSASGNQELDGLVRSFNEMSDHVIKTQDDLKLKLSELELANQQIMDTQLQLVQSAKMASLGQLVAGVAHELNNPIGFIFSNMEHLKQSVGSLLSYCELSAQRFPELAEDLETIDYEFHKEDLPKLIASCQEGARRTRDIVLGLRNFSRIDEAEKKEVDLNESIETTLELLKPELKSENIDLVLDLRPLPLVELHASQTNQVLMNTLVNAIQAIQMKPNPSKKQIQVSSQRVNREIKISICDSGVGMTEVQLGRIFEPFYSTKPIGKGTGLGLSISHGIITKQGGRLEVESEEGVGTCFHIFLPI